MDGLRTFLLAGAIIIASVNAAKLIFNLIIRTKCVGTQGYLAYTNDTVMPVGRSAQGVSYPIYGYRVGNVEYFIELSKGSHYYGTFPLNVEVQYFPADPEIGFVNGYRGRLVSKVEYEPEVVAQSAAEAEVESDNPWRGYY